jgi:hypothetical protein
VAAPNIVNVAAIYGKTAMAALADTSNTVLLNNPASSGKVFKVNTIMVANKDGASPCDITIRLYSQDDAGGTGYYLASTISVPADATLDLLSKPIYLEEDRSIYAMAGVGGDLDVVASYEEIS